MTSRPVDRPVSPLRARMIEDMTVRGFGDKTRNDYIRHVPIFGLAVWSRSARRRGRGCFDPPQVAVLS